MPAEIQVFPNPGQDRKKESRTRRKNHRNLFLEINNLGKLATRVDELVKLSGWAGQREVDLDRLDKIREGDFVTVEDMLFFVARELRRTVRVYRPVLQNFKDSQ